MSPVDFLNINGKPVDTTPLKVKKTKAVSADKEFHKGWAVSGIPPNAMEDARAENERLQAMAEKAGGTPMAPFDPAEWLASAKLKKVRPKNYEIESSAYECAELAKKAGWTHLVVVTKSKGRL